MIRSVGRPNAHRWIELSKNITASERTLIESLPKLPALAKVRPTNIWIIEWLSPGERRTGSELHAWMEQQRPRWSIYNSCTSKIEVIRSIERATHFAQRSGMVPILHVEAHGGDAGLAPSSDAYGESLSWIELTIPLQQLNLATNCNLIVVVAACLGFAAIQALTKGPRAQAVALVGPDATLGASDLLIGAKEFYRRFKDDSPRLADIAESASREMFDADFECEPFATLAYEALVEQLVRTRRPTEHHARLERLRQRMDQETVFSVEEIEARLAGLPKFPPSEELQQIWNYMFMIDLEPKNEERFGLNWKDIADRILAALVV